MLFAGGVSLAIAYFSSINGAFIWLGGWAFMAVVMFVCFQILFRFIDYFKYLLRKLDEWLNRRG